MIGISNYIIYGVIIGSLVSLIPYVSGKQGHEPRAKFLINMVVVKDTDHCNNSCFHIHHWMWIGILLLYTFYVSGQYSVFTQFLFGAWLSSSIAEMIRYPDARTVYQKCFPNCKVQKKVK